jgi:hypothetical protein
MVRTYEVALEYTTPKGASFKISVEIDTKNLNYPCISVNGGHSFEKSIEHNGASVHVIDMQGSKGLIKIEGALQVFMDENYYPAFERAKERNNRVVRSEFIESDPYNFPDDPGDVAPSLEGTIRAIAPRHIDY